MTQGDRSPQILGVYSRAVEAQLGMGGSSREAAGRTYWFVRLMPDDSYELRPLNSNCLPTNIVSTMGKRDFMEHYRPELGYYEKRTMPVLESLKKKLAKGQEHFQSGELDKAECEFCKAMLLDETNVAANTGLGAIFCERQQYKKLQGVIDRLMGNDLFFLEEERHRFNDFGINLRKAGMYRESISFYEKAVDLNPEDEHLLFNLARVHFEQADLTRAMECLETALELNPEFPQAKSFLALCRRRMSEAAAQNAAGFPGRV